jgi:cyclophilin family peptidyl-prolyl cis-trans isomerase
LPFWSRRRRAADEPQALIEALEDRLVLFSDPFLADLPALDGMTNILNTIVRMQTNRGFIDIELFDVGSGSGVGPASITTNNFLNYIRTGRYDNTFFHRMVVTPTPFVLQGGGYALKDPLPAGTPKYDSVAEDAPIVNEFNSVRSNVERTIAMALRGSDRDSATSQFFFNLADNHANLDFNQFTVFGKVIHGWETVTDIQGLQTRDLDQFLTGSNPQLPPGQGLFDNVPVSGPNDQDVVTIKDIEVIKPKNQTDFYTFAAYYPEGYRSGHSTDTVQIVNNDPNAGTVYQVIARFESGQRDRVVGQGFLAAGARISLSIYEAQNRTLSAVRGGVPLGYEVRSSGGVGVSLNHFDFGATAGESFINAAAYDAADLQTWSFANGQKGPGLGSFLLWLNLVDQPTDVTAFFYPESGAPFVITKTVQPYRRGGLDVNQLAAVPAGLYSVHITSTHPIVASLSQYRFAPARAATESGVIAGGSSVGVLPAAQIPNAGQSTISVVYAGAAAGPFTIDLDFILADGTVLTSPAALTVSSTTRRHDADLSAINGALPHGQFFTIRYRASGGAKVSMAYTSINHGDTMTTAFQTVGTERVLFADGFLDPQFGAPDSDETISLYNPFMAAGTGFTYRLRFHFAEGTDFVLPVGSLMPGKRVDISVRSLPEVMAQINMGLQFRHYSITVETTAVQSGMPVRGAVFAQLTRINPATIEVGNNTMTTGPALDPTLMAVFITDPRFS